MNWGGHRRRNEIGPTAESKALLPDLVMAESERRHTQIVEVVVAE